MHCARTSSNKETTIATLLHVYQLDVAVLASGLVTCCQFLISAQDDIVMLGKAHTHSALSLSSHFAKQNSVGLVVR